MYQTTQNITEEDVQVVNTSEANATVGNTMNTSVTEVSEKIEKTPTGEQDDESEDEDTDEDTDVDSDINFPTLSLKDGTELYVVTVDGVPYCYTKTIQEARTRMWDFARICRFNESQFNTYIREFSSMNNIEVVGYTKFSIINVDRTICWLKVRTVQEVEEVKESQKRTGLIASLFG
jgi:hypothetical protein